MMDGTLMVYKVGDVARTSLRRSTSLLRSVDIDLLGIILNAIRADVSADYQDLGYSTYYAYGSEVDSPERDLGQRVRDRVNGWRRRLSPRSGDGGAPAGATAKRAPPPAGEGGEPQARPASVAARVAAYGALLVTAFGLLWQSGYLDRHLGLIPVLGEGFSGEREEGRQAVAEAGAGYARTQAMEVEAPGAAPAVEVAPATAAAAPERGAAVAPVEQPYAVRVASYPPGSRWAARSLRRLRQSGETAYFSPVESRGQVYERLLLGRFASWDGAYQHARRLREAGTIEEFSVLRLPYSLDAGTFATRAQADDAATSLDPGGRYAHVVAVAGGYAARAGAFPSPAEAEALQGRLGGAPRPGADNRE